MTTDKTTTQRRHTFSFSLIKNIITIPSRRSGDYDYDDVMMNKLECLGRESMKCKGGTVNGS